MEYVHVAIYLIQLLERNTSMQIWTVFTIGTGWGSRCEDSSRSSTAAKAELLHLTAGNSLITIHIKDPSCRYLHM